MCNRMIDGRSLLLTLTWFLRAKSEIHSKYSLNIQGVPSPALGKARQ